MFRICYTMNSPPWSAVISWHRILGEQLVKNLGGFLGLLDSGFGQVGVVPAAKPVLRVPGALAVAHHHNLVDRHVPRRINSTHRSREQLYGKYGDFTTRITGTRRMSLSGSVGRR